VKLHPELQQQKQHKTQRLFSPANLTLSLGIKLVKFYVWSTDFYSDETCTLRKVDRKYLESFEMWCWRRMENIIWTDRVRTKKVLQRVEEEKNILQTIKR
jgi:hypothetical protein